MDRLKDKIALVTGAAQGIGLGCAELFAKEGAFVYLTDINDEVGKKAAAKIGSQAKYLHLDVQSESSWDAVISQIIKEKHHLDILVNNAGIMGFREGLGPQDPENATLAGWDRVHAVNTDGVFLGCKKAIHVMKPRKGSIVNISSRSGIVGIPGAAAYAASKAAVRNHTKTVALYCCEKGYDIRCNSLHPAAIFTPLWDPLIGSGKEREQKLKDMAQGIPMKRLGTPEDVAYAALFLASDEAAYITGAELIVDGGVLAGSSSAPGRIDD